MGNFDGRVAFVTGGARGQGRSHALHLARAGADIVICDSLGAQPTAPVHMASEDDLKETVRLIEAEGRKVLTRQVDVRDLDGMIKFADDAVAEFGRIDILLANAGIMSFGALDEMSETVWQDTIDTNLTGVFNSFRAVVPHMKKAGYGRIVATSSGGGRIGFPNLSHYVAAKWGVIGLVKSLALEVCKDGITVNAVTPTNVNTDMIRNQPTQDLFMPGAVNPTQEEIEAAFVINPMGVPWLEASDVSRVIMFLVSEESKYITGETIGPLAGKAAENAV